MAVSFQNPPEITGVKLADLLKLCLDKNTEDAFSAEERRLIEAFRLGIPNLTPIPLIQTLFVMSFSAVFSLVINDMIKFALVEKAGVKW